MNKPVILDSDTISFLMKKQPIVLQNYSNYIAQNGYVYITRISVFEILSGLKAKGANAQLERFKSFLSKHQILEVTELSVELSSDAYAQLVKQGKHSGYNDLLIAGIALANNFALVTNNIKDFKNIADLSIINWTIEVLG